MLWATYYNNVCLELSYLTTGCMLPCFPAVRADRCAEDSHSNPICSPQRLSPWYAWELREWLIPSSTSQARALPGRSTLGGDLSLRAVAIGRGDGQRGSSWEGRGDAAAGSFGGGTYLHVTFARTPARRFLDLSGGPLRYPRRISGGIQSCRMWMQARDVRNGQLSLS